MTTIDEMLFKAKSLQELCHTLVKRIEIGVATDPARAITEDEIRNLESFAMDVEQFFDGFNSPSGPIEKGLSFAFKEDDTGIIQQLIKTHHEAHEELTSIIKVLLLKLDKLDQGEVRVLEGIHSDQSK